MTCHNCQSHCRKFGKHRNGLRRFQCRQCSKTFTEDHATPLDGMYTPVDKADTVLRLLVEGCSISTVERITGTHHTTILKILVLVGERLERFSEERIRNVPVQDVQADEIWGFVGMKEKRKTVDDDTVGDAYCFTAIESNTKLILTWHLGRRTERDTFAFTEKIDAATAGRFQITTDGFGAYRNAVDVCLGTRVDFAQLVKVYWATPEGERRYSPAESGFH